MRDYTNLVNTTYKNLTIQKVYKKDRYWVADCLCSCGKITHGTYIPRLLKGNVTSCKSCAGKISGARGNEVRRNTSKYNALIGKQIHYFTVLRRSDPKEHPGCFDCKCICGNIRYLDANALLTADQKSCGCQQPRLLSLASGGSGIPHERTAVNEFLRKGTKEYTEWVKKCLKKCNYTYFISGQSGVPFNVHHLTPLATLITLYQITIHNYKQHLDILFDVNNGIVLTTEIHRALHKKYGSSVSVKQLTEFKEEYQLTKTLNK